jgi:hypothetical protein
MPYISDADRERAILYLVDNVPEMTLMQIYEEIHSNPDWLLSQHFGLGIDIRNCLRFGGFTWDDTTLDREWEPLTVEAARRNYMR